MISVQNVSKSFGPVQALVDVSFEINQGEVMGLLGPNGAGKTTMMRLLTGLFPPSSGKITVLDEDLVHRRPNVRKKIGYLAENNPLYGEMTTKEFLQYVSALKGVARYRRKSQIAKVVDQCSLGDVMNRYVGKLSKGFRQRVGLAQTLLGNPELLILDEPTSGLDPTQIIDIRNLIKELGKERTVILSTHILPEARMTCQNILILNNGRLVASGSAEMLEDQVKGTEEFVVKIKGSWRLGDRFLHRLSGIISVRQLSEAGEVREYSIVSERGKDARSQVATNIVRNGFELLMLKPAEWNLEEIFLKIVTSEQQEVLV